MRSIRPFLHDLWTLLKPYWVSSDRWPGRILLGVIIMISLFLVYLNVRLNTWNGEFYNALQDKNEAAFWSLLIEWGLIVCIYVIFGLTQLYLQMWLRIRWREWLTRRFIDRWLSHRAYYRLQFGNGVTDNPDQRIAEDLKLFIDSTLQLSLGFLRELVTLVSFVAILWQLSGSITLDGITIPGYMVWVALGYAIVGTWLTHMIGRKLIGLTFDQQRYEADFRFGLVRFRENAEAVALYRGEDDEKRGFGETFGQVVLNWRQLMTVQKNVFAVRTFYSLAATIFPIIVAAPRYFSGAMQLGGITQTAGAFGQVHGALSFFVDSYTELAQWRAVVERLTTFERAIADIERAATVDVGLSLATQAEPCVTLNDISLDLPDGRPLLQNATLNFVQGQRVLVTGASGAGKSTLFRTLAGIWPFGRGRIVQPEQARMLFLPQRPYLPIGALADVLRYPERSLEVGEEQLAAALRAVHLSHLIPSLGEHAHWAQRLSGGEQQRIAIARALVIQPDWLYLDEATSAVDEAAESELYQLLEKKLPKTSIISIGHHASLRAFHSRELRLARDPSSGEPGHFVDEAIPAGALV
jgi:vitamin B12/bleomycin/antimicrobial peptide transport system ATP-binding/permease protein